MITIKAGKRIAISFLRNITKNLDVAMDKNKCSRAGLLGLKVDAAQMKQSKKLENPNTYVTVAHMLAEAGFDFTPYPEALAYTTSNGVEVAEVLGRNGFKFPTSGSMAKYAKYNK